MIYLTFDNLILMEHFDKFEDCIDKSDFFGAANIAKKQLAESDDIQDKA